MTTRRRLTEQETQRLLTRNPFAIAVDEGDVASPTSRPPPRARTVTKPLASNTRFGLKGTLCSPTGGFAIIYDSRRSREGCHAVGTTIAPDVELLAVERSRALLAIAGRQVYITTSKPTENASSAPPASRAGAQSSSPAAEELRVTVPAGEIKRQVSNLSQLFSQIRFAPYFERGKQKGFKILSIRPGSFPDRLGAKKGDILHAVDGQEITSIRSAFNVFRGVKDAARTTISLVRQGRPVSITLERE